MRFRGGFSDRKHSGKASDPYAFLTTRQRLPKQKSVHPDMGQNREDVGQRPSGSKICRRKVL